MLAPSLWLLAASLPALAACNSSSAGTDDEAAATGGDTSNAGAPATGGQAAGSGGATHGSGGAISGSGGGSPTGCGYPADDFLKMNDATYQNTSIDDPGQACDPIVSADYIAASDKTEVWAFSGWDPEGDGSWYQQLVLNFPGHTTGEFTDVSAAPASVAFTSQGSLCPGYLITITVDEYGEVGGKISGSFQADLLDAQQSGHCPGGVSGEFSVTRKR